MKIKSNIDLGKAFDLIKEGLKASEKAIKEGEGTGKYLIAHSLLAGFTQTAIDYAEDKEEGEIQDDIPEQLFRQ